MKSEFKYISKPQKKKAQKKKKILDTLSNPY